MRQIVLFSACACLVGCSTPRWQVVQGDYVYKHQSGDTRVDETLHAPILLDTWTGRSWWLNAGGGIEWQRLHSSDYK